MAGEPFTPCKLRHDAGPMWEGVFLLGKTIAYRVDQVRGRTLHVTRWPLDEIPEDAATLDWSWTPRTRRRT